MKCDKCTEKAMFETSCLKDDGSIDTKYILCIAHYIELSAYMTIQARELLLQMNKN